MGEIIKFARPDGGQTNGYLARAGEGLPGVVIIQEWWGLNDHIKSVADRFAERGYNALAPDLYKGRVATDADEAGHMMGGLNFPDATHQDIQGAVYYLHVFGSRTPNGAVSKVGVVGFCMGGALTIAAAVHVPGVDAAVCFYGIPPADFAAPADIKAPFQGHFANRDDWCTPAAVDGLVAATKEIHHDVEIHRYDADHAFFNNSRADVYDSAAAKLAWDRTHIFFDKHLR